MVAPAYHRHLSLALIHRSAWLRNSANFAFWGFSEVHLITFNRNLAHLSDTPTPLTGVCCTRYVGPDKARRYRAHEQIPGCPIGGVGSRRRRWSTGRWNRVCRGRELRRGEVL